MKVIERTVYELNKIGNSPRRESIYFPNSSIKILIIDRTDSPFEDSGRKEVISKYCDANEKFKDFYVTKYQIVVKTYYTNGDSEEDILCEKIL